MVQVSAFKYASRTGTGVQGYNNYMTKYNHTYVPTYTSASLAPLPLPSAISGLDAKKQYAKLQAKQFEDLSKLMSKVLACFEKEPGDAERHVCVEKVAGTTRDSTPPKEQ